MKRIALLMTVVLAVACAPKLTKSGIDPKNFESEYNGSKTELFTLTNDNGMELCITNFGARIVSIMVPDRNGDFKDVVLGFDTVEEYFPENNDNNFGATIGRYANRVNQGRLTIDGVEYQLPQNNYGHCLHGGPDGWRNRVFEKVEADRKHVKLKIESPDGDAGFPGNVTAFVTFTIKEDNTFDIDYEATTDKETVINMPNHSYFNLAGDPANHCVEDDILFLNAGYITPVDDTFMTNGELASVEVDNPAFDFLAPRRIGDRIGDDDIQLKNANGYDHCWVLATKCDPEILAVECVCPETGICLQIFTDEPGVQVYAGNFLDGTMGGKKGIKYPFRHAICFEPGKYPDTPNKPQWPSATVKPGETYKGHASYYFTVEE
ncbi:MAG: galactose mutarotase [Bacteroidales bacterium]|nr:galactose mutarotase [Bacteroidales bacterium]